ncbi:MerR family transcriptional regulator [Nocardia sp. NPDC050413]|uniref:MerR family transcriptional regulator n=1 Tax=Nocardia sp. NPDC050413 TaxID=3155784 RepID=UPI0033C0BD2C
MTHNTRLTIGELAARTGIAVRTVRYYCDEGLLAAERTSTGHRTFGPDAVDRLNLLRRLRALGIGLAAVAEVLAGTRALSDVIAAEREALAGELAALRRREALLTAVSRTSGEVGVAVDLVSAVADPRAAHDVLVGFWRRQLAPLPSPVLHDFIDMNVPRPPTDADPQYLLTYAELVAAVRDPRLKAAMFETVRHSAVPGVRDEKALLLSVAQACLTAAPLVAVGEPPRPGAELDHYVHAHATVRAERDTPEFRARLLRAAPTAAHRVRRYWRLTTALTGEPVTSGAAHLWLFDALAVSVARADES